MAKQSPARKSPAKKDEDAQARRRTSAPAAAKQPDEQIENPELYAEMQAHGKRPA